MPNLSKLAALSALLFLSIGADAGAQAPLQLSTNIPDVVVHQETGHWTVPAGYDSDVAMHPYTSGLGPCTEGASPSQGCHHSTGNPLPPSRYDRPPFNQ